jgi:hypothetical protein
MKLEKLKEEYISSMISPYKFDDLLLIGMAETKKELRSIAIDIIERVRKEYPSTDTEHLEENVYEMEIKKIMDAYPDSWKCTNLTVDGGSHTFTYEREGSVIQDTYLLKEDDTLEFIYSPPAKIDIFNNLDYLVKLSNHAGHESTVNIINSLIRYNLYSL